MTSYAPTTPPTGWYLDPDAAGTQRWWDGTAWTEHRAPALAPATPGFQPVDLLVPPAHTFGPRALIWGIIAFMLPIAVLPAVLALVFSIPALVAARRARAQGHPVSISMPLAGLILGSLSILFIVGVAVVTILTY